MQIMHVEQNAEAAELYLRNVSSRSIGVQTIRSPFWSSLVALTRQAGDPTTLRSDSLSFPTNGIVQYQMDQSTDRHSSAMSAAQIGRAIPLVPLL